MSSAVITVFNQSSVVTDAEAEIMVQATNQALPGFCTPWRLQVPRVRFVTGAPPAASLDWEFILRDNSDVEGALAYHTETNGKVTGYIFAKTILSDGGVVLYRDDSTSTVASALTHEIYEALADPVCDGFWQDTSTGLLYCQEVADPVQDGIQVVTVSGTGSRSAATRAHLPSPPPLPVPDFSGVQRPGRSPSSSKPAAPHVSAHPPPVPPVPHAPSAPHPAPPVTQKVGLSNFILPAWHDRQHTTGPYDALGKLTAPYSLTPGGYAVVSQPGGQPYQIYGTDAGASKRTCARFHVRVAKK
eukprot:gnl/Hemi2/24172_TR8111_c0_g1_i1.p1 gnl/Hemi2/24172_TR8111_c0_g1~~gnl/Hemi2/24172_TR8111_c0_g1_i1.p1  ORF type:complete len:301 (-),score=34.98 gnl/Hemi2/24172_TR8111_c0_g1_i1:39-941(-)